MGIEFRLENGAEGGIGNGGIAGPGDEKTRVRDEYMGGGSKTGS